MNLKFFALIALCLAPSVYAEGVAIQETVFKNACTRGESWTLGVKFEDQWKDLFRDFLSGKMSAVRGFSEAMALRAHSQSDQERLFAEYWASRALYQAKLPHIAQVGLASVAGRETTDEAKIVQMAALQCLVEIQKQVPSLELPQKVVDRIWSLPKGPVTWEAAALVARDQIGHSHPAKEIAKTLRYLEGSGIHQELTLGFWNIGNQLYPEAIEQFNRFLQDPDNTLYTRFVDVVHLLLGRAYYATKQLDQAAKEFNLVRKSSNELPHSLAELAWSYLKEEKYQESVGTATNLHSGGLKNTFAPESYMVMAMAFNELCYFPEALKAMQGFRDQYVVPYEWLQKWEKAYSDGGNVGNLYPLALAQVRRKGSVPIKVASEWIRSPLFMSRQDEIDEIFLERRQVVTLGQAGAQEARGRAADLLKEVRDIKPKYLAAKEALKDGEELPESIESRLKKLRRDVTAYRRLRRGAEPWHRILAYFQQSSPGAERKLVKEINEDLVRMNRRMLTQLNEVAENTHFIEVEIYNGASQDMVWKNAHPDYEQVEKGMANDHERPSGEGVWDWGNISGGMSGSTEVWEDELGSYRAELVDHCSNREKYLAVKQKAARSLAGQKAK